VATVRFEYWRQDNCFVQHQISLQNRTELAVSAKFGTSGLRGLSSDLIGRNTFIYVSAFAQHLLSSGQAAEGSMVCVGRDFRDSSPAIAQTAMQALHAAKFVPINCQTLPTPALAHFAMKNGSAALMVTGSHTPADRNGIKFYKPDGEIDKADETEIFSLAERMSTRTAPVAFAHFQFEGDHAAAKKLFIRRNAVILPANDLAGLRVGVYQHSSVARDMLVEVLQSYGAIVTALGRSEMFIPVDTEAVSEEISMLLKSWASTRHFDVFISADSDGDRPLVADETGNPVRGDIIGLLTAEFLKAKLIATTITSNSSIERQVAAKVIRTRVGSPYVIDAMNEALKGKHEAVIGFEANGGVLTGSHFMMAGGELTALPTRDCFLPILAMLHLCKAENEPLSQILALRKFTATDGNKLENFPLQSSAALMKHLMSSTENLAAYMKDFGTVAETSTLDGLRITLEDKSIVHYRPSGNAPELRCYVEAESNDASRDLLRRSLAAALGFNNAVH
jgi:phosphomannomutase